MSFLNSYPWNLIDIHKIFVIVCAILAVQILSRWLIRVFGRRLGVALSGFLGGFISSTGYFLMISARMKSHAFKGSVLGAALFSVLASMLECFLIIWLVSRELAVASMAFLIPSILICFLFAFILARKKDAEEIQRDEAFDFFAVIRFSLLVCGMVFLTGVLRKTFGAGVGEVVSFVLGFFELHAITFANTSLYVQGSWSLLEASDTIALALLASLLAKIFIAWTISSTRFAIELSKCMLVVIAAGGLGYVVLKLMIS